jgi:hypothetical protein
MIESLKGFKRSTALGVLSRAALALLSSEANPSALPSIENELSIREKIIFELAGQMGLSALDLTDQGTRERLSEALDHEAEALDPDVDFESAIQRLSERGQLPSDLFDISISEELLRIGYRLWGSGRTGTKVHPGYYPFTTFRTALPSFDSRSPHFRVFIRAGFPRQATQGWILSCRDRSSNRPGP